MIFAMVTIVYGSSRAVKEQHIKKRLAYSTISNLSYIIFGAALMTPAGLIGSLTHMVFHAVMKITLFFCVGAIMYKTHREYVSEITGFGKKMPVIMACFTISSLAVIGIPPLAGFISKWNLASAAAENGTVLSIIGIGCLLLSALLTAIYLMTIVVRAYFPSRDFNMEKIADVEDPNWLMKLPVLVLSIAVIGFGIYAVPLMNFFAKIAAGLI